MDSRVVEHARILTEFCLEVGEGDHVLIEFDEGGLALAEATAGAVARRGGQPLLVARSGEASRAFLAVAPDAVLAAEPKHLRALVEASDKLLFIQAGANTRALSGVPAARQQARAKALEAIREVRMGKRWCLTLTPTPALAQEAGLSTEAFEELAYSAILIDWPAFAAEVERVKARLDGASEVHVVAPDADLYLPVKDRTWIASTGQRNMPSGEVFTAPHEGRVEGHVLLDLPAVIQGTEVAGVRLAFEKGELVDWSCERGEAAFASLLETDEGARRLGELGIGMNRGVDRPTRNILFDEKMGGTIHLALGRAYTENKGTNKSAVHQDLVKTMGPGSYLAVDGDVVQRNGWFWYEQGFRRA